MAKDPRQLDEEEALLEQLSLPPVVEMPPSDQPRTDAPTSNTMPVTPPAGASPAAAGASPSGTPYTGFTPKHDYSAFDTQRQQDPSKSAKDAFAMLSNQAPPPPFQDKAALAAWFKQYIEPGMNALGHKVSEVTGDTFTYGNHEGNFAVDYAQNAGATPGSMLQRLQWGASPAGAAGAPAGPTSGGGSPAPGVASAAATAIRAATPAGGNDAMAQILAEIEALQNGGTRPLDATALMQLLGA